MTLASDMILDGARDVDDYRIIGLLGRGRSGEVYSATRGESREVALKLYVPFFQFEQLSLNEATADMTTQMLDQAALHHAEYRFLVSIDHPFIVDVVDVGRCTLNKSEADRLRRRLSRRTNPEEYKGKPFTLPYIVTRKISGNTMRQATAALTPDDHRLISRSLENVAAALEYLHKQHEYLHGDVKVDNVMIRAADRLPVLIDFALCKNLNFDEVDGGEIIELNLDWSLTPDEQLDRAHPVRKLMRQGGARSDIKEELFPWLDFFQFGKMLESLLEDLRRLLPAADARYAQYLAEYLTNWPKVQRLGSGDLTAMVGRLGARRTYRVTAPVPADGSVEVPLSNNRRVLVPSSLQPVLHNASLNRLSDINQLSLVPAFLPGATHKRMMHVLETLRLTQALMLRLGDVPQFRMLFGLTEVTQAAAVALLHDINHFPFLHVFQESEVADFGDVPVVDLMCEGDVTGERQSGEPSVYELLEDMGIDRDRFKRLVLQDWTAQDGEVDQIISSMLKSGVDVDKLSYLPFDSELAGVGLGVGNAVEDLIRASRVVEVEVDGQPGLHLAFDESVLPQIETVMSARLANFQQIYWLNENRGLMVLLLKAVRRLMLEGGSRASDLVRTLAFESDRSALSIIARMYRERFEQDSYLDRIYGRPNLFPVQVHSTTALYRDLVRQTARERSAYEDAVRRRLMSEARTSWDDDPLAVLVDVPRRPLSVGGRVFTDGGGSGVALSSSFVERLRSQYSELSETVRVYLSPRLREALLSSLSYDEVRLTRKVDEACKLGVRQLQ